MSSGQPMYGKERSQLTASRVEATLLNFLYLILDGRYTSDTVNLVTVSHLII